MGPGLAHLEIVVGVLSAFTLLLLVLFVGVIAYSRRQKLLTPANARRGHRTDQPETKVTVT